MFANIFIVETIWRTIIRINLTSGQFFHGKKKEKGNSSSIAYLYIPNHLGDYGFLIPGDELKVSDTALVGQPWPGLLKSVRLKALPAVDRVELIEPRTGHYASARELDRRRDVVGELRMDCETAGPWESFRLHNVRNPPSYVVSWTHHIDALIKPDGLVEGVAQALSRDDGDYSVLQACGRLIEPKDIHTITDRLTRTLPKLERYAHASNVDRYARAALPDLINWLADRTTTSFPRTTGPEDKVMERAWYNDPPSSFTAVCTAAIRSEIVPRKRLAVLATARNEGLYLLDWIAYHRSIGVQDFFIYTNNNDDGGSDQLLNILNQSGIIKLIYNIVPEGIRPQFKAYGHALQALPEILDYTWVAALDIDEYISYNENKFKSLSQFLEWHECVDVDSIGLSWLVHTPNSRTRYSSAPVIERFPNVAGEGNEHIKSIFRPNRFVHSHCHFPVPLPGVERIYRRSDRSLAPAATPFNSIPDYKFAWIGHYYFKSVEEYLVRRLRNRGDGAVMAHFSEEMISSSSAAMVVDEFDRGSPSQMLGLETMERVRRETAALQAIPGVMEALALCEANFADEAHKMRSLLHASPRFQIEGSAEAKLLTLLDRTR